MDTIQWTVFSQIIEQMWLFDKKPKDFSYLHRTRENLTYNRHPFIHMGRCFQVYRLFTVPCSTVHKRNSKQLPCRGLAGQITTCWEYKDSPCAVLLFGCYFARRGNLRQCQVIWPIQGWTGYCPIRLVGFVLKNLWWPSRMPCADKQAMARIRYWCFGRIRRYRYRYHHCTW